MSFADDEAIMVQKSRILMRRVYLALCERSVRVRSCINVTLAPRFNGPCSTSKDSSAVFHDSSGHVIELDVIQYEGSCNGDICRRGGLDEDRSVCDHCINNGLSSIPAT